MCGLFAFVGHHPDPALLRLVALEAGKRGPHACGWAWPSTDGIARVTHAGPIVEYLPELETCAGPLLGHARLATSGDWRRADDHQPLRCGRVAIAHNGTVPTAADLARRHGLHPVTSCDSEILGILIEQAQGNLAERAAAAVRLLPPGLPYALLVLDAAELVALRRRHPLAAGRDCTGWYLCSRAFPAARSLPDQVVVTWQLARPEQPPTRRPLAEVG